MDTQGKTACRPRDVRAHLPRRAASTPPMERPISLDQLDFRLLNVFVAIFREGHVGRAADALGMSQPVVSTQLARLRRIAGDPLFVRTARGMQPSALALRWSGPVASALQALERALNAPSVFDAAQSQRTFVVYMTDVGQTLMLNRLISRLENIAPGVRLRVVGAWQGALVDRLNDGSIDIAFGWIPQLKALKSSSPLFKDRYVGVHDASATLPSAAAQRRFALADIPGSAHQVVVERFRTKGLDATVTAPNFFMLPELLAGTSLVAVVPERLVALLNQQRVVPLCTVELPVKLPAIAIQVHWSTGTWRDEGVDWLRDQVVAAAGDLPALARH